LAFHDNQARRLSFAAAGRQPNGQSFCVVIPIIRAALDKLLSQGRKHAKSELVSATRGLELQVAELEAAVSALELALNVERGRVLDLPKFPLKAVN
jgi:hypothetical protein